MHNPHPDTSEYAALVEFIATGGRSRAPLKPGQDASAVIRHALAQRASAMAQAIVAVASAAIQRKH